MLCNILLEWSSCSGSQQATEKERSGAVVRRVCGEKFEVGLSFPVE